MKSKKKILNSKKNKKRSIRKKKYKNNKKSKRKTISLKKAISLLNDFYNKKYY